MRPSRPTHRRRLRRATAVVAVATVIAALDGCSGSSLDDTPATSDTVTIGLIWPQSGVYTDIGKDLAAGWQFYLDSHGGKLGGHQVKTVTADEGAKQGSALTAAKKLLDQDKATVLVGTASADASAAVAGLATERRVPLVGTGGRPSTFTDVSYIWHTSWLSREMGRAVVDYIKTTVNGPVYAIGPDYQGGYDQLAGFTDAFLKAGGTLANPDGKTVWTPFPSTTNFLPYLNPIKASDAKAVYTFYAGESAKEFVKQYRQAGLTIPLYGAGFLTEGSVLDGQGEAADGVRTVMNYAANLDNSVNRAFAPAFQAKFQTAPNIYHVTGYDAALVLDQALAGVGDTITGSTVNAAIGRLGVIDSPRGPWRFGSQHAPNQAYYLREVKQDGRARANVVIQNLTTLTN